MSFPKQVLFADFEKVAGFERSFCSSISKTVHICFDPSQNVSPILFPHALVMVTNERPIACKCLKPILNILNISNIVNYKEL